jgi:rhamnose transport system ATP-binding protein
VDTAGLVRMMVGRELRAAAPARAAASGDVLLDVRRLSCADRGLHDVSLEVRAGEIVGVFGLVGSGRTEFAETLFGLSHADAGEVRLRGRAVRIDTPEQAIRAGLAYLPEDRLHHGVVADMPIAANVSLATMTAIARWGLLDRAAERTSAEQWVERLRIKTPSVATHVDALSGGNQQKVALARWLETKPSVLILDEPTQGVDVGSKSEIHALIQDLAARGLAIVMISSELPEILSMSDRIAVMSAGTIVDVMPRGEATEDAILHRALGHAPTLDGRP